MKSNNFFNQILRKLKIRNYAKANMGMSESSDRITDEPNDINSLFSNLENVNRYWDINSEFSIKSHRPILGRWIVAAKKSIRKLLRWYVNPIINQQRIFNSYTTKTLNNMKDSILELNEEIVEIKAYIEKLKNIKNIAKINKKNIENIEEILDQEVSELRAKKERNIQDIEESLIKSDNEIKGYIFKLELLGEYLNNHTMEIEKIKTANNYLSSKYASLNNENRYIETDNKENLRYDDDSSSNYMDYFMFELEFRGTRHDIKERQKIYLPYFIGKEAVLDIGCGRGEFLELLTENNINAKGIDSNFDMAGYCQGLGLDVQYTDALEYLRTLEDESVDGIFMAQVIEHLPKNILLELIKLCSEKLKKDGVLVIETPNPMSLIVFSQSFYIDLTHVKPVHPSTAKFICETFGFNVEMKFTSQVPDGDKLPYPSKEEKTVDVIDKLNNLIYGPRDYAIICHKPNKEG